MNQTLPPVATTVEDQQPHQQPSRTWHRDTLGIIFSFLPLNDLSRSCQVSHYWYNTSKQSKLRKEHLTLTTMEQLISIEKSPLRCLIDDLDVRRVSLTCSGVNQIAASMAQISQLAICVDTSAERTTHLQLPTALTHLQVQFDPDVRGYECDRMMMKLCQAGSRLSEPGVQYFLTYSALSAESCQELKQLPHLTHIGLKTPDPSALNALLDIPTLRTLACSQVPRWSESHLSFIAEHKNGAQITNLGLLYLTPQLTSLSRLTNLTELRSEYWKVEVDPLVLLPNFPNLRGLHIRSWSQQITFTEACVKSLIHVPQLTELLLHLTRLDGSHIVEILSRLMKLKSLTLQGIVYRTPISFDSIPSDTPLSPLRRLSFLDCSLSENELLEFHRFGSTLESIYMDDACARVKMDPQLRASMTPVHNDFDWRRWKRLKEIRLKD